MALSHPAYSQGSAHHEVAINPVFTREPVQVLRDQLPSAQLDPDIAHQLVHDELMLAGNARLNLVTFVTTWTGCSTTGSSEACMLAGLALKRRWQHARRAAGEPLERPNIVMGVNVQVC